eukprot:TRINITY_DN10216_c0_g1_i1.p2 TRINITY_DN10216_c0_g1~~TRINITY_DN10216_c0_g1_i1.p2  ORF type:complete len:310 (+),score=75.04 TRINITY_DN10216_c0_g1_i1:57-986(+)
MQKPGQQSASELFSEGAMLLALAARQLPHAAAADAMLRADTAVGSEAVPLDDHGHPAALLATARAALSKAAHELPYAAGAHAMLEALDQAADSLSPPAPERRLSAEPAGDDEVDAVAELICQLADRDEGRGDTDVPLDAIVAALASDAEARRSNRETSRPREESHPRCRPGTPGSIGSLHRCSASQPSSAVAAQRPTSPPSACATVACALQDLQKANAALRASNTLLADRQLQGHPTAGRSEGDSVRRAGGGFASPLADLVSRHRTLVENPQCADAATLRRLQLDMTLLHRQLVTACSETGQSSGAIPL